MGWNMVGMRYDVRMSPADRVYTVV
ncbi:hypothetical protein Zm00014a_007795 [Zea mays]|uniref:Uncharacterized protein n=1 Tax=Zea mays TaxID=4577 RepID=A0A3L6E830_MAIZE|nr:hypothetical protein Zm00014a_007795 [Zea mays]